MSPVPHADRQSQRPKDQSTAVMRPEGPLVGITVIDLTRVLAGPYCTMILADLGARVIKVEQPGTGDDSRAYGPFIKGTSAYFASLNRGKESIALDLKKTDDRAVFDQLLATADVVVENFRPGTMEKLGYGWDALHAKYPRLIYAAASGFGHSGPYSKRAAYDMVVQAMGGIMSITGHPGQPPVRVGTSVGDITAGLFTAIGVNAALLHRALHGVATKVDVAMLDCQVAILENAISRYAATGEIAGPIGARHPSITPFAGFEASDGWVVIAAGNDQLFKKMCEALDIAKTAGDPRFATNALRSENWQPLFEIINRALAKKTVAQWLAILDGAGVPCGAINTIDKVLSDPHVRARNMVVTADDPSTGPLQMAGNPIKLAGFADPSTRVAAPALDQDRDTILNELQARRKPEPSSSRALAVPAPLQPPIPADVGHRTAGWIEGLRRAVGRSGDARPAPPAGESFAMRIRNLSDALLSERGEVLGTVIAHDLAKLLRDASARDLFEFAEMALQRYGADTVKLDKAIEGWRHSPSDRSFADLARAVEPPRQELFRRINMAPGGTATLVGFRKYLLTQLGANPEFAAVDSDLSHLFSSWFNRGFLEMRRIDWRTPAVILEKLIAYEAVHAIDGWDDLKRRLASDRRCFAFFHPVLPDEPLIFIEVALVDHLSDKIEPIIRAPMPTADQDGARTQPRCAIFYSISNCQPGLRGVSFGNFLIKQVASDLAREFPSIKTFSTLSPMPTFRGWLKDPATPLDDHLPKELIPRLLEVLEAKSVREAIDRIAITATPLAGPAELIVREVLTRLAARYLSGSGLDKGPRDPVARFHLGNGARIERINWRADLSSKGLKEAHGLMVNYLYDLDHIEANHEAFANRRPVATSKEVAAQISRSAASDSARSLFSQVDVVMGRFGRKSDH